MTDLHRFRRTHALRQNAMVYIAAFAVWTGAVAPLDAYAQGARGPVTLNFSNADIDAVARSVASITGRSVVLDPRVKGSITLVSTQPLPPAQAVQLFAEQLRTQGFALVEANGTYLVLPEADAKLRGNSVSTGARPGRAGGQIVTQIFRLTHENANNLVPVLRPLISPNNTINVNPGTNALVITDYADNLQRLARIITALDVSNATGIDVIKLRHAVASDLAPLVARLLESGGGGALPAAAAAPGQAPAVLGNASALNTAAGGGNGDGFKTTIVPEPRSNALIVRAANPARVAQVRALVEQLDQPPDYGVQDEGSSGNIHVVHLKNADATKLATTLRAALAALPGANPSGGGVAPGGGMNASGWSGAGAGIGGLQAGGLTMSGHTGGSGGGLGAGPTLNPGAANQPSTGGQIQADPSTNSLIISAPEPVYRQLRAVIDRLDERRAQVYIEALIAEVNDDADAQFGIQWQGVLGRNGDTNVGYIGTNFGNASSGNIFALGPAINNLVTGDNSTVTGVPQAGINLALAHRFGAGYLLSALANFLQTSGKGNVLSRPTLLTLDNEEAKIIVGQNVPFPTGSYTNNNSANGAVNPFQTYDRKDVGVTLRVRPQINENGAVKLVIYQEASDVVQSTLTAYNGPTTNMRSIESSVIVDDGQIVVLGGLMRDAYRDSESKVPLLGDIPVVGNLFKSRNRVGTKSNLMVFLRPVVLRDGAAASEFSAGRYDEMRAQQIKGQPASSVVVPVNRAPALPQRPVPNRSDALGPSDVPPPARPNWNTSDQYNPDLYRN